MIASQSRPHGFSLEPHKEILRLGEWEEYVGILRDVKKSEGMTLLEFDDCCIEFRKELDVEKHIGKKIGVLRTDIEGREVAVREV